MSVQPKRQFDVANSLILVTHVPKCAGTSLEESLKAAAEITDDEFFAPHGNLRKVMRRKQDFRYIRGHWPFRQEMFFHPFNPVRRRPIVRIATLREPMDRLISAYYFHVQRGKRSYYHKELESIGGIVEFYERIFALRNHMTRMYLGYPWARKEIYGHLFKVCPKWIVRKAVSNVMAHYPFWVSHSHLAHSYQLLSEGLGVKVAMQKYDETVTRSRPGVADLDSTTLDKLRRLNELDFAFYEALGAEFERKGYGESSAATSGMASA